MLDLTRHIFTQTGTVIPQLEDPYSVRDPTLFHLHDKPVSIENVTRKHVDFTGHIVIVGGYRVRTYVYE